MKERIESGSREIYRKSIPTTMFAFLLGIAVGIVISMVIVSVII